MVSLSLLLVLVIGVASTVFGAPQRSGDRAISSSSSSNDNRQRLLNLVDSPPSDVITFDIIDFPIVREFFKDRQLVQQLVTCFDITEICPRAGLNALIQDLAENFVPGTGCTACPQGFNQIVTFAQNQFRKNYKEEWNRLVQLIPDHIG